MRWFNICIQLFCVICRFDVYLWICASRDAELPLSSLPSVPSAATPWRRLTGRQTASPFVFPRRLLLASGRLRRRTSAGHLKKRHATSGTGAWARAWPGFTLVAGKFANIVRTWRCGPKKPKTSWSAWSRRGRRCTTSQKNITPTERWKLICGGRSRPNSSCQVRVLTLQLRNLMTASRADGMRRYRKSPLMRDRVHAARAFTR